MPICARCPRWAGDEDWRTLCPRCFRVQKTAEDNAQTDALSDALRENQALRQQIKQMNREAMSAADIPEEKLKRLIQLCHPDKHNGSKVATEITQWLLEQRKHK